MAAAAARAAPAGHVMLRKPQKGALVSRSHTPQLGGEDGDSVRYLPALVELGDGVLHLLEGAQRLQLPQLHLLDFLLQGGHVVLVGQAAAPLHAEENKELATFHRRAASYFP